MQKANLGSMKIRYSPSCVLRGVTVQLAFSILGLPQSSFK